MLKQIATEQGLGDLFVEFMTKRFPNEKDQGYILQWAERFKTGDPCRFMDNKSLAIYSDIIRHQLPIISEDQARAEMYCRGCGENKDLGLVVCWNCFKYRTDVKPLKYYSGDLSEWLKEFFYQCKSCNHRTPKGKGLCDICGYCEARDQLGCDQVQCTQRANCIDYLEKTK